ncbi:MAG: preprotein translocase subunit SecA [Clostridia bacterium]|nr:preprotein translocase subunit SecA [Clostridia bacterium]
MGLFLSYNDRQLKPIKKVADKIEALSEEYSRLSDAELKAKTAEFKARLANGETLEDILVEAFATVREASFRVIKQKHYYVQLIGGIVLHQGRICQMSTGEGKTLVSTLPAYLNALTGKGVHIVTVNDYLAHRDAEWMGKIHKFLGLSVGVIHTKQNKEQKQEAYNCDITYGTNSEFGFDFLRDNMQIYKSDLVQRDLNFTIIDEVDSILIDEARTPLIISGKGETTAPHYFEANRFICTLTPEDYEYEEKFKAVRLLESGVAKAERYYKVDNLGDIENTELNHYVNQALRARVTMMRDRDYIVEKGQVIIVDEFTGRKMEGRRFSNGLHQAIEAKEGVRIQEENKTLASISYQNLFRLYKKLSGMTGTAKTEEDEFMSIYNIDVIEVPTNKPLIREDYDDVLYKTLNAKNRAIVEDIKKVHAEQRPILIGTISVEKSEELSRELTKAKIAHNTLNAKNHMREAEIVAQAGKLGAVTIATNMAGRGTDILLGGNPEFSAKERMRRENYTEEQIETADSYFEGDEETAKLQGVFRKYLEEFKSETDKEKQEVVSLGGLHIIGTERHESRRIDNQLRGRSGRQGDPGSSVFFISLEDDLARVFGGDRIKSLLETFKIPEDQPIVNKMFTSVVERAQKSVEAMNFGSRKSVLEYDDVVNVQRNLIYAERRKALNDEDVHEDILDFVDVYVDKAFELAGKGSDNLKDWDLKRANLILWQHLPTGDLFLKEEDKKSKLSDLKKEYKDLVLEFLEITKKENEEKGINFSDVERFFVTQVITRKWMDHIDVMDQLKSSVRLQAYAQKDPQQMYKAEGYRLYSEMQDDIKYTTVRLLIFRKPPKSAVTDRAELSKINPDKDFNKPCPCGSNELYKNCCGRKEYQEMRDIELKKRREERKKKSTND